MYNSNNLKRISTFCTLNHIVMETTKKVDVLCGTSGAGIVVVIIVFRETDLWYTPIANKHISYIIIVLHTYVDMLICSLLLFIK